MNKISAIKAIEGNTLRLDGGSMFGNTPKALWQKWCVPDERNRIQLASRALLVQTTDGRNILFEAGVGVFFDPKMKDRYGIEENEHLLLKKLEQEGFSEKDIDAVVLSHLHFDHAGGLLTPFGTKPALLFPNAKYYVGTEHWNRAQNPHAREQASFIPELHTLLQESNRLILIEGNSHPDLNFGVKFHLSNGHTIGLLVSQIESNEGPIFFCADLIPGIPWLHLPITMGYDRYPELLVNEKKALLNHAKDVNGLLYFSHDLNTPFHKII